MPAKKIVGIISNGFFWNGISSKAKASLLFLQSLYSARSRLKHKDREKGLQGQQQRAKGVSKLLQTTTASCKQSEHPWRVLVAISF